MDLKGKNILVTGGGSGLGRGYVETFRGHGANVLYGDLRDPGDLDGFINCDVTSWDAQVELFDKAVQQLGTLDVVIANAGIGGNEEFNEYEDGTQTIMVQLVMHLSKDKGLNPTLVDKSPPTRPNTKVVDVNFNGVLFTAKLAMHQFAKQKRDGKANASFEPIVVLGGSLAGYMDFSLAPIYSSTKFAVRGLFTAMRHTAPRIKARVGMIAPWHVETPMLAGLAGYLKEMKIPIGLQEDVVSAVQELIVDPKSNGRCYAGAVPREVTPKGYLDVDEKGYEEFWSKYTAMLISEDSYLRPLPNY